LADDDGASWSDPIEIGGDGTIANSQCAVDAAGSFVSADAHTLTLVISVTFDAGFAGPKTIFGLVRDVEGGNSDWQSLGSWNVEPSVLLR
jgi:hypothetical protein